MIFNLILSWTPAALWASVLFYLSSRPSMPGGWSIPLPDKVLHLGAYFVFGAALAWAGRAKKGAWTHGALIFIGVAFAFSDEWHQSFVPGRHPSGWDLLADVIGVGLGYATARWFLVEKRVAAA